MSERAESSKSQFLRVVPSRQSERPSNASGTKILTEDGTEIKGVTRIELIAEPDNVWRGVIHFMPIDVPELTIDAVEGQKDASIGRSDLAALLVAIQAQTEAINRLAQSNAMLVQAMAEATADVDPEQMPTRYMDGTAIG